MVNLCSELAPICYAYSSIKRMYKRADEMVNFCALAPFCDVYTPSIKRMCSKWRRSRSSQRRKSNGYSVNFCVRRTSENKESDNETRENKGKSRMLLNELDYSTSSTQSIFIFSYLLNTIHREPFSVTPEGYLHKSSSKIMKSPQSLISFFKHYIVKKRDSRKDHILVIIVHHILPLNNLYSLRIHVMEKDDNTDLVEVVLLVEVIIVIVVKFDLIE